MFLSSVLPNLEGTKYLFGDVTLTRTVPIWGVLPICRGVFSCYTFLHCQLFLHSVSSNDCFSIFTKLWSKGSRGGALAGGFASCSSSNGCCRDVTCECFENIHVQSVSWTGEPWQRQHWTAHLLLQLQGGADHLEPEQRVGGKQQQLHLHRDADHHLLYVDFQRIAHHYLQSHQCHQFTQVYKLSSSIFLWPK